MMTRLRKRGVVLLVIAVVLSGFTIWRGSGPHMEQAAAQQKEKPQKRDRSPDLHDFMRVKLGWMDLILEGLLVDDFKKIERGATKLRGLSNVEKWRVSNDIMYRNHSEDFQQRLDKLIAVAKEGESLDRAALAWMDTTMSCIECHRWVRTVLIADAPALDVGSLTGTAQGRSPR